MNVIKTILLLVCVATHINSVDAAWKRIERPFDGVILVDPNLTIEYEITERCYFFKISLYNGKIIIFDVCKHDIDPMLYINNPNSFSKKVMLAFERINSNPIGKELLDELSIKINDPLVIIHHDILLSVLKYNNIINEDDKRKIMQDKMSHTEYAELASKLSDSTVVPDIVLNYLTTLSDKREWLDCNYLPKVRIASSFFCKDAPTSIDPGLPCNTIMLNFELKEPKLFGFSKKFDLSGSENKRIPAGENIEITCNLEHEDDITLFHELNHAKHRICGISTYDKDGVLQEKSHSSLGIQITGIDERSSTMVNSEEELQLTGFTQLKDGKIISDHVNEIAYRFNSGRRIRFPYAVNPKEPDLHHYISIEHLKLLLKFSLGKTCDVFFVD